ncbi:hypothetical protein NFI96_002020 [Prochilodus magdalenae]|nr:hypothetical protein NFI96_002020 [Prochilodus magdalenae]
MTMRRLCRALPLVLVTICVFGVVLHLQMRTKDSPKIPSEGKQWSPKKEPLRLHDIFIAVKTTGRFHGSRLELLLDTWISKTKEHVTEGVGYVCAVLRRDMVGSVFEGGHQERRRKLPSLAGNGGFVTDVTDHLVRPHVYTEQHQSGSKESKEASSGSGQRFLRLCSAIHHIGMPGFNAEPSEGSKTYIFTDTPDEDISSRGFNIIVTGCSPEHSHQALSCKMAAEYDHFMDSDKEWLCHVDDDNYLNPKPLLSLLSTFSPHADIYIGKPSLNRPMRAQELLPGNKTVSIPLRPLDLPHQPSTFSGQSDLLRPPFHRELMRG